MKKWITLLLALLLIAALAIPAAAEYIPHMFDEAGLLSSSEAEALDETLADLSDKWDMDIVVVTADDLQGASSTAYADDFYDYGGYGKDGILWLIDMDNRKSTISTSGYGITVFTDAGQDYMQDLLAPMLSDGEYAEAIDTYIALCDDFCREAEEDEPYDVDNMPDDEFSVGTSIIFAIAAGVVVAFIGTAIMKGKLKSVRAKAEASDYVKPGSLQLTESRDFFLYRHIDRRAKPKDSGGSSTHTSSSGNTHGGSSRSF